MTGYDVEHMVREISGFLARRSSNLAVDDQHDPWRAGRLRSVKVYPRTWRTRFERLAEQSSGHAKHQLDWAIQWLDKTGRDVSSNSITRAELVELAEALDASHDHGRSHVRLFVAAMMWGSGTTNGRGPWRTGEALCDPTLTPKLLRSHGQVRDGRLAEAHSHFAVSGIGESFATKWLWVCSLQSPALRRTGLILDLRVRRTLFQIQPLGAEVVPRGSSMYAEFVEAMHLVAEQLRREDPIVSAEFVEWLLFERPSARGDSESRCLYDWAKQRHAS